MLKKTFEVEKKFDNNEIFEFEKNNVKLLIYQKSFELQKK